MKEQVAVLRIFLNIKDNSRKEKRKKKIKKGQGPAAFEK